MSKRKQEEALIDDPKRLKTDVFERKCPRNFNTQYARIVKRGEKLDPKCESIHIKDYEKNKNKGETLVCGNNHKLEAVQGGQKKWYFRHSNPGDITCQFMSEWHVNWQGGFPLTEVLFPKKPNGVKNRYADALIGKKVLEFQHSFINRKEVQERGHDYRKMHGHKLVWVIDGNETVDYITYLKKSDRWMIKVKSDKCWAFESFLDEEFIYIDFKDYIYRIEPGKVKSLMIDVPQRRKKEKFIKRIFENRDNWKADMIEQCRLYYNQFGAGTGKTYNSIQILQQRIQHLLQEISLNLQHKRHFIYITKQHAAKDVIFNELKNQLDNGQLELLEVESKSASRKHIINFKNLQGDDCTIVISTVDAFNYGIGNTKQQHRDFFKGLVHSIIEDGPQNKFNKRNGNFAFAGQSLSLSKQTLIILDEAQDLDISYGLAYAEVMRNTYVDFYIIGDVLQSISTPNNIMTHLQENGLPNIEIIKSCGKNICRRFHNKTLQEFVNGFIPFDKYNLPSIEGVCDDKECKYHHSEEDTVHIIQVKTTNMNTREHAVGTLDKIMNHFEEVVNRDNARPEQFMFISPMINGNFDFICELEDRLSAFWTKKMSDEKYVVIISQHENWKGVSDSRIYVKVHRSEVGQCINLEESKFKTMICSIHTSKGQGREYVFLIGMSESALNCFAETGTLVYDSLCHVAVTRQKLELYLFYESINDDIYRRLHPKNNTNVNEFPPIITGIKNYFRLGNLIESHQDEEHFQKIYKDLAILDYEKDFEFDKSNKEIIDWGHHVLSYSMIVYSIWKSVCDHAVSDEYVKHLKTVLDKISRLDVKTLFIDEYSKMLSDVSKANTDIPYIPVLKYDEGKRFGKYNKYSHVIIKIINNIQKKIKSSSGLPNLCPVEMALLLHIQEIYHSKNFANSWNEIYAILFDYSDAYSAKSHGNDHDCLCDQQFSESKGIILNPVSKAISSHYDLLGRVNNIMDNLRSRFSQDFQNLDIFDFNINTVLKMYDVNITIYKPNALIAKSKNYVILFYLKPTLSVLNYKDLLLEMYFNHYLTAHCIDYESKIDSKTTKTRHEEKFRGKKIISCIITLESEIPIVYELPVDDKIIQEHLEKMLSTKMQKDVRQVMQYCCHYRSRNFKFEDIDQQLKKDTAKKRAFPRYILDSFAYIVGAIEQDDILEEEADQRFEKTLQKKGKKAISEFTRFLQDC